MNIRIMDIVDGTIVDGPGLRTSVYTSGCAHACPGCHNSSTWPFDAGRDTSVDEIMQRIIYNGNNVTLSGGDPMYQAEALLSLAQRIRREGLTLWCYTGFLYEELLGMAPCRALLDFVDVLVDGPFVEARRNPDLRFRGSDNQRIIDVAASLSAGTVVELAQYTAPVAF